MKKIVILSLSIILIFSCDSQKEKSYSPDSEKIKITYYSDYSVEYIISIKNTEEKDKTELELYKRSLNILISKLKEDKSELELYKMTPDLQNFLKKNRAINIFELNFLFLRDNPCNVDISFCIELNYDKLTLRAFFVRYLD